MEHGIKGILLLLMAAAWLGVEGSLRLESVDHLKNSTNSGSMVNFFQQVQNSTKKQSKQKHMSKEIEILVDLMEKAKNYSMRADLIEKAKNYSIIAVGDLTRSKGKGDVLKVVDNIMETIMRKDKSKTKEDKKKKINDKVKQKPDKSSSMLDKSEGKVEQKGRRKRMRTYEKNQDSKMPNLFGSLKQRRRVLKKRPVTAKGMYWKQRLARNPKNILTDAIYRYDVRRTTPPTTRVGQGVEYKPTESPAPEVSHNSVDDFSDPDFAESQEDFHFQVSALGAMMALNGQGSHQPDTDQIPGHATSQQIQKTATLGPVGALPSMNHDMIEPAFTRPAHNTMPNFASFPAVQGSPIGPRPQNSEAPRAQHTFPVPVPPSSFMSFPATPGSNLATDATTTILPIYTPPVSLIAKPTKANHSLRYSPTILPNTIFTTPRTLPARLLPGVFKSTNRPLAYKSTIGSSSHKNTYNHPAIYNSTNEIATQTPSIFRSTIGPSLYKPPATSYHSTTQLPTVYGTTIAPDLYKPPLTHYHKNHLDPIPTNQIIPLISTPRPFIETRQETTSLPLHGPQNHYEYTTRNSFVSVQFGGSQQVDKVYPFAQNLGIKSHQSPLKLNPQVTVDHNPVPHHKQPIGPVPAPRSDITPPQHPLPSYTTNNLPNHPAKPKADQEITPPSPIREVPSSGNDLAVSHHEASLPPPLPSYVHPSSPATPAPQPTRVNPTLKNVHLYGYSPKTSSKHVHAMPTFPHPTKSLPYIRDIFHPHNSNPSPADPAPLPLIHPTPFPTSHSPQTYAPKTPNPYRHSEPVQYHAPASSKSYPTPFSNSFTVVDVPYPKPTSFHKYGYQTTTQKPDVMETRRKAAYLVSPFKLRSPSPTRANPGITKPVNNIALGSEKAIGQAFELFHSEDDKKHPRRIRLIGPIAVRAIGPKTFTLVEQEPIQLETLEAPKFSTHSFNDMSVFSKRPSLQFDKDAKVSASFPQIRSLLPAQDGPTSPTKPVLSQTTPQDDGSGVTNYLASSVSPQDQLPGRGPTTAVGTPAGTQDSRTHPGLLSLPQGSHHSGRGVDTIGQPPSASVQPFKTAVAAHDMNLGSPAWLKGGVQRAIHFEDEPRQNPRVRFEETTPHYDDENALMFSRSFRFPDT